MNIEQLSPETFKALEHFRLNFWKELIKNNRDVISKNVKDKKIYIDDKYKLENDGLHYYSFLSNNGKLFCRYFVSMCYGLFGGYILANGAKIDEISKAQSIAIRNNFWCEQAINILK